MAAELGKAALSTVASKAAGWAYDIIGEEISFVWSFQRYIDAFNKQVEDLKDARERVEKNVEYAKRQGNEIFKDVEDWLTKVDEFIEKVVNPIIQNEEKAAKERCFMGLCPNFFKRRGLSKEALKATNDGGDLLKRGNFSEVSYRPALHRMKSMYLKGYENFDSRVPTFQEIIDALKNATTNIIGVHGMGGVGKTTLVKKVVCQAKEENLFDTVVMAEVTQNPDYKRIQEKIAYDLGLEFGQETEFERVGRLRNRLKKEKTVLVVLDDIWQKLELEDIGIPFLFGDDEIQTAKHFKYDEKATAEKREDWNERKDDQKRYKLLLTSRNQHVLVNEMKSQKNVFVSPLSHDDAWNFFEKIVGASAKKPGFQPIADEIVTMCGGLPVAISTIANALRTEKLHTWEDALYQLRNFNPRKIDGNMEEKVFPIIRLSYNFLKNKEAKSLFLLCGQFMAGIDIFIEGLLARCMGLGLLESVYTLNDGRNRVHKLIDNLKDSCLLLDGTTKDMVKMHEFVHTVAVSISKDDELMFNIANNVNLKKVLEEEISKDSTAISLPFRDSNDELPERLEFPKLKLFSLIAKDPYMETPSFFFERLKELKVLSLGRAHFSSLSSSICCLESLRTLIFEECRLGDIAIVGKLKKLEILVLLGSDIEVLPGEIGQLTRLKLLDLSNCQKLKVISPKVISSLSQLEELCMTNICIHWEVEGLSSQERTNASLSELKQLSHLTTLRIQVPDIQLISEDLFSEKLKRYTIIVGDDWDWSGKYEHLRTLKLKLNSCTYWRRTIKILLKTTEELHLELSFVENAIDKLNEDGFPQLKHLHVQNSPELLYLVNSVSGKIFFPELESLFLHNLIKLEKICHSQLHAESFSKLRVILIRKCDKAENLFSFSMAKNLSQLQEITVTECKNLKSIFAKAINQTETNCKIEFPQLHSLQLMFLRQLKSFGLDMVSSSRSQRSKQSIAGNEPDQDFMAFFSDKVVFPRLENLMLVSINMGKIWPNQIPALSSLTSLTVDECNNLKFLFSSSMVESSLSQLQKLVIVNCKSMESIIDTGMGGEKKIVKINFPKLSSLVLARLSRLTRFGTGDLVEFPSLKDLQILGCPYLETFFSSSSSAEMMSNQREQMNLGIFPTDIHPLFDKKVVFPSLESMLLVQLDEMQLIWHKQLHEHSFCKLKVLVVEYCEKLVAVIPSDSQTLETFQNLESLDVRGCWSLRNIFPVSIAASLLQLKNLSISFSWLEEIVAKDEGQKGPKFVFPQLTNFSLQMLPELKGFYQGIHTIDWPKLKELFVYDCPKIKIFGSEGEGQLKNPAQQPLFYLEKVLPNLERVSLNSDGIALMKSDHFSGNIFGNLKGLDICGFKDDSTIFPVDFLKKFYSLERLGLFDSDFKELFPYKGLPPIKHVRIVDLPLLEYTWEIDSQVEFLENLVTLQVEACNVLTYLMPSFASLKNLTVLEVWSCNSLENILTFSTAKSLVQLRKMSIRECHLLIEVIENDQEDKAEEEEIVLCQLRTLKLHCLTNLTCFCSANYALKFPYLEEVYVTQCPKLNFFSQGNILSTPRLKGLQLTEEEETSESFYFLKIDLNSTFNQMFTDMVQFWTLEDLRLSEFSHLKENYYNGQFPIELFNNLRTLTVDQFSDISSAIPFNLLSYFTMMEMLVVSSCVSLQQVFDFEGPEAEAEAEAEGLNADIGYIERRSHQQILGFNNLKWLKVDNCNSLKYIFTPSLILGLVQLQVIEIRSCSVLEEIIKREKEIDATIDKIIIPRLKSIVLEVLPNLTSFYSGSNILECPSFSSIIIKDCPKIFNKEVIVLPSLKDLTLSSIMTEWIWQKQPLGASSCFQNLMTLEIDGCDNFKQLFSSSMVKSLVQLHDLNICNCKLIEGVIVEEEEEENISKMLFPKLYLLQLKNLPRLTRFCNSTGNFIQLPSLNFLWIDNCPSMKTFISNSICADTTTSKEPEEIRNPKENVLQADIQPFFDKKVRLPCLETLIVEHMDELRKIWDNQLSLDSFCELKNLDVRYCNKLLNVFPSSMLGIHQSLRDLNVSYCDSLEEIFDMIEERSCIMEESDGTEEAVPGFVFSKLTTLHLKMLPSLKCIFPRIHISGWPVLKDLKVYSCHKVEVYVSEIQSFRETHEDGEGQHHISIQHPLFLVDQKVAFPCLEKLKLGEYHIVNEMSNGKFLVDYCKIEVLKLRHFSEKDAIFPSRFLHTLPNLKELYVSDAFFNEIFVHDGKHVEALSQLKAVKLSKLPQLLYLWKENSIPCRVLQNLASLVVSECGKLEKLVPSLVSFQNLTTLEVSKCEGLINLMTLKTAETLMKLRRMNISECKMIEEIIVHVGDEEVKHRFVFRWLKYLGLQCLPSLESFCSDNCTLEFPSLNQVVVRQCPKMEIFSRGVSITKKLQKVQLTEEGGEGRWEGNLNSTIQQLFKETNVQSCKED